jgi:hypothetical protein
LDEELLEVFVEGEEVLHHLQVVVVVSALEEEEGLLLVLGKRQSC